MTTSKPFHLLLKDVEKADFLEFSRHPDLTNHTLKCDCAGLITLLLKKQGLFPKDLGERPKVIHYYQWIEENREPKRSIMDLDRHDVLLWKKTNPPKSGDTGHILLLLSRPKKIADNLFSVETLEVNRIDGLTRRVIKITTYNDGRLKGVAWHPDSNKVKETPLIAVSLFKKPVCSKCNNAKLLCQCDLFPKEKIKAPPIIIFRHPSEKKHPLASVPLLQNYFSNLIVEEGEVFAERPGILLYPESPKEISKKSLPQTPINDLPLILIDASWKKSHKILQLNPWLLNLPRFSLEGKKSEYFLRKQRNEGDLSSLESFCYSWQILFDGDQEAKSHSDNLMHIFKDFIDKRKNYYGEELIDELYSDR